MQVWWSRRVESYVTPISVVFELVNDNHLATVII
jgi:hypothetical protein